MKKSFSIDLNFTISKIMGIIVIILGAIVSLILKESESFIIGSTIGSALIGVKTSAQAFIRGRSIKYQNNEKEAL